MTLSYTHSPEILKRCYTFLTNMLDTVGLVEPTARAVLPASKPDTQGSSQDNYFSNFDIDESMLCDLLEANEQSVNNSEPPPLLQVSDS
jgi:hypothetical protein